MVTIIGLCGSLRNGSFNRMLLHAAVELCPPGMTIEPESLRASPWTPDILGVRGEAHSESEQGEGNG